MTLSPVFRSPEAFAVLQSDEIWPHLSAAAQAQARANATVLRDLPAVIDRAFIADPPSGGATVTADTAFCQEFFFLILFRSVLQTIGVPAAGLGLCAELNFCIKGQITAADNIFDGQDHRLLPLARGAGRRFNSILELLVFERLTGLALVRGIAAGAITPPQSARLRSELLSRMAAIGSLEGSEEEGVGRVLDPEAMIDEVHAVRGGALFELAFIAPRLIADAPRPEILSRAERAASTLGTAFQIVDDITDFEFDVANRRHNLLTAEIVHHGTPAERAALAELQRRVAHGNPVAGDIVAESFAAPARTVLARARERAAQSLRELESLGFWFPARLSDQLVRAIAGAEGVERVRSL